MVAIRGAARSLRHGNDGRGSANGTLTCRWPTHVIQEISGVVKAFVPPGSACYECGMTERDYQLINLRYSCPLLKREDVAEGSPPGYGRGAALPAIPPSPAPAQ